MTHSEQQHPEPTVVVAEDEAVIRLDLVEQLAELGYRVVGSCGDGAQAVALCTDLAPDLALLDVNMPVMDGLAAAARIGELGGTAVVMITAYGQRELVEQAVAAGVMGYLTKPWSRNDLVAALTVARGRHQQLRKLSAQVGELQQSLADRKLVDRAKAHLIAAHGLTEAEAFRLLQRQAMDARTSMAQVAAALLAGSGQRP